MSETEMQLSPLLHSRSGLGDKMESHSLTKQ
ncbi:hypothetical protein I306_04979 [Cryptococcus gattii EJB2]|uniref:Uncharacterized protein n=1 Tax=Cryptococcus gattii EJB2 TaxID=1296103 RepID=A0ABR5BQU1_9TREE|nr:hypothetical protein I306_04979 [Cryptococcus gattii EJB2]